jgi:hypothetical protein
VVGAGVHGLQRAMMHGGDGREQIVKMLCAACVREPREVERPGLWEEGLFFFCKKT